MRKVCNLGEEKTNRMKQPVNFVAGQLTHELDSDRMFFKPFFPGLFVGGAFFALTKGHEFLRFFDDILTQKSLSTTRNKPSKFVLRRDLWPPQSVARFFKASLLIKCKVMNAQKRVLFTTLLRINLCPYNFWKNFQYWGVLIP